MGKARVKYRKCLKKHKRTTSISISPLRWVNKGKYCREEQKGNTKKQKMQHVRMTHIITKRIL